MLYNCGTRISFLACKFFQIKFLFIIYFKQHIFNNVYRFSKERLVIDQIVYIRYYIAYLMDFIFLIRL